MNRQQSRLKLNITVFEQHHQRALVLPHLKPAELIRSILQEFQELEYLGIEPENFMLIKYNHKLDKDYLDPRLSLGRQLKKGDHLYLLETVPEGVTRSGVKLYLREQITGQVYKLHQLPAIIGRQSQTLAEAQPRNESLAVNLQPHAQGLRVSQRQAKISQKNGEFFVESLGSNPTLIKRYDQTLVEAHSKERLVPGDIIWLQRSNIELKFIVRDKTL